MSAARVIALYLKDEATAEKTELMFRLPSKHRYQKQKKLTFNLKPYSISKVLPEGRGGFAKAKIVTTTLNNFMASADPKISLQHVPRFRTTGSAAMPAMAGPDCPDPRQIDKKDYIDPEELPVGTLHP